MRFFVRFLLTGGFWFFALSSNTAFAEPSLRIAVASNFKPTLEALMPLWRQQSNTQLIISSGPSGVLTQQVISGAPFDILLAADSEFPAIVQQRLATAPPFVYSQGLLILGCNQAYANSAAALQSSKRLALANIKTAPYGRAAWQWLQSQQLQAPQLADSKVVQSGSVAGALQTVTTGNASCGLVAASFQYLVPELFWYQLDEAPRLAQAAVVIKSSHEVEQFSRFLLSDDAQGMMQQHGYLKPSAQP